MYFSDGMRVIEGKLNNNNNNNNNNNSTLVMQYYGSHKILPQCLMDLNKLISIFKEKQKQTTLLI